MRGITEPLKGNVRHGCPSCPVGAAVWALYGENCVLPPGQETVAGNAGNAFAALVPTGRRHSDGPPTCGVGTNLRRSPSADLEPRPTYLLGRAARDGVRIAVMGMGVAGSYLMARLQGTGHEAVGYELSPRERHDSICAWGTIRPVLEEFCEKVGRDFGDYLIHDGKRMHVRMSGGSRFDITLKGLCTYDKLGLIKEFMRGCDVRYGRPPPRGDLEKEYDMVVDCTGFHRAYLPRLKEDFFLPTYEYKVEYDGGVPYDDFYIEPFEGMTGYFWYFPLGEKWAHVGAGDYNKNHVRATDEFLARHGGRVLATKGRPIRLATPDRCKPYRSGKVVGVGESIGTVYALLGEGIIPSMQCAELFLANIGDMNAYERAVEEHYRVYAKVFRFVRSKIRREYSAARSLPDFVSIYRYMKRNEDRFGMHVRMADLIKVARA